MAGRSGRVPPHAEHFGTYMDGDGVLIFDGNDLDEAYLGHFTWDIQRFAASMALLGWGKALSRIPPPGVISAAEQPLTGSNDRPAIAARRYSLTRRQLL